MTLNIQLRSGQHTGLANDLENLYDAMVDWQLKYHVPVNRSYLTRKFSIGSNTLSAWFKALEALGHISQIHGYWTVNKIEYVDKRQWLTGS